MRLGRIATLLALAVPLLGAAPEPDDPPVCREALARHPETTALEALAEEEKRIAIEARRARRGARKIMRQTLGAGAAALGQLPAYEALARKESEARAIGKALCYCRERRGDPHREDCELLYPAVIP